MVSLAEMLTFISFSSASNQKSPSVLAECSQIINDIDGLVSGRSPELNASIKSFSYIKLLNVVAVVFQNPGTLG